MPKQKQLGPELKRIRAKLQLTQEEFAELMQLDRRNLATLEGKDVALTTCWRLLLKYIEEYGVDLLRK